MEHKFQGDCAEVYSHVDAAHRKFNKKIEHLDKRTSQQVFKYKLLTFYYRIHMQHVVYLRQVIRLITVVDPTPPMMIMEGSDNPFS